MRTRQILRLLAIVWLGTCASPTLAAPTVSGLTTIVDGDTFEIGKTRIRLFGVDAFEGTQTCTRGSTTWKCGIEARGKLRSLIGTNVIACDKRDTDGYNRMVAVCHNGAVDLGAELVRAGLALAYRQYSDDYVDEEQEARSARRGVWAGDFTAPWDYRHRLESGGGQSAQSRGGPAAPLAPQPQPPRPDTPVAAAPSSRAGAGCNIKGNVSRKGERIYHLPGSPHYAETAINESAGERWFCSEADARAAGWRAARG